MLDLDILGACASTWSFIFTNLAHSSPGSLVCLTYVLKQASGGPFNLKDMRLRSQRSEQGPDSKDLTNALVPRLIISYCRSCTIFYKQMLWFPKGFYGLMETDFDWSLLCGLSSFQKPMSRFVIQCVLQKIPGIQKKGISLSSLIKMPAN